MRAVKTIFAIAALAWSVGAVSSALAAEPLKLRMSWVAPVANWTTMLLEKKELMGHLGKSYTLETLRFQGTPPMITALAAGELEIADLAYSTFGLALDSAGMDDLRLIADDFQDGVGDYYSNQFLVLKDGPIHKVEDLKGKIIAINVRGSGADIAMRALMRKHGLEDKRDFTVVEVALPNMKVSIMERKVDMALDALPFTEDPVVRNNMRVLATQKDAIGPSQFSFYAARGEFIQKNRAVMVDFLEDMQRVVRFYLDPKNHKEAVEIAARLTKQPPELYDSWLYTKKDYYRDPGLVPDRDALQANLDTQLELGFIKRRIDVKAHTDLSLIQEAAKRIK